MSLTGWQEKELSSWAEDWFRQRFRCGALAAIRPASYLHSGTGSGHRALTDQDLSVEATSPFATSFAGLSTRASRSSDPPSESSTVTQPMSAEDPVVNLSFSLPQLELDAPLVLMQFRYCELRGDCSVSLKKSTTSPSSSVSPSSSDRNERRKSCPRPMFEFQFCIHFKTWVNIEGGSVELDGEYWMRDFASESFSPDYLLSLLDHSPASSCTSSAKMKKNRDAWLDPDDMGVTLDDPAVLGAAASRVPVEVRCDVTTAMRQAQRCSDPEALGEIVRSLEKQAKTVGREYIQKVLGVDFLLELLAEVSG